MKTNWKKLLICLGIPLAVGGLATLLSGGMGDFSSLKQPPLSPPGWLFPVAWTVLYLLMGYASYRIVQSGGSREEIRNALTFYGIQLFINFLWPVFFFGLELRLIALLLLVGLWVMILLTIRKFTRLDETAGDLLIPYLLWVTFAGYLNLGVVLLN